jgi:hypothetical protein
MPVHVFDFTPPILGFLAPVVRIVTPHGTYEMVILI